MSNVAKLEAEARQHYSNMLSSFADYKRVMVSIYDSKAWHTHGTWERYMCSSFPDHPAVTNTTIRSWRRGFRVKELLVAAGVEPHSMAVTRDVVAFQNTHNVDTGAIVAVLQEYVEAEKGTLTRGDMQTINDIVDEIVATGGYVTVDEGMQVPAASHVLEALNIALGEKNKRHQQYVIEGAQARDERESIETVVIEGTLSHRNGAWVLVGNVKGVPDGAQVKVYAKVPKGVSA